MVTFIDKDNSFHMTNGKVSCILKIQNGRVLQDYFGPALPEEENTVEVWPLKRSFTIEDPIGEGMWADESNEIVQQAAQGFYGQESLALYRENGQALFDFRFDHIQIHDYLIQPEGMPGAFGQGKTAEIILLEKSGLALHLFYGLMEDGNGMVCWSRLSNHSLLPIHIRRLSSFRLLFKDTYSEMLSLASCHLHEGMIRRQPFLEGIHSFSSRMGSSSGMHFPFAAVLEADAGWNTGDVLAAQLLYSGNHETLLEKTAFTSSMQMGIHSADFDWKLETGQSFDTPQAVLVVSHTGLNGMANAFHRFYLNHLIALKEPQILLNSWESLYYDTTDENIRALTDLAAEAGIERFVLDDGWFRTENSSRAPIGDWQVNREKLPGGLESAAVYAEQKGLEFGLWIEPEAVSSNSRLFCEHPDWIMKTPWVEPRQGRHEYLLNLSKKEVVAHLKDTLDRILECKNISYLKWDMNRPMSDFQNGRQVHQYILGLYEILHHVQQRYPHITIEGCASGGQRLDGGMLYYVAQNWASDNTDSFDRVQIQSGLSLLFPPQVLCSHVSAEKNHQTHRITPMDTRFQIIRFFHPGYELQLADLTQDEFLQVQNQIRQLKEEKGWMAKADFLQEKDMWIKRAPDRSRAEVLIFQEHFSTLDARKHYRIFGLTPDAMYSVEPLGLHVSGARLAHQGICLPLKRGDFRIYPLSIRKME